LFKTGISQLFAQKTALLIREFPPLLAYHSILFGYPQVTLRKRWNRQTGIWNQKTGFKL